MKRGLEAPRRRRRRREDKDRSGRWWQSQCGIRKLDWELPAADAGLKFNSKNSSPVSSSVDLESRLGLFVREWPAFCGWEKQKGFSIAWGLTMQAGRPVGLYHSRLDCLRLLSQLYVIGPVVRVDEGLHGRTGWHGEFVRFTRRSELF